MRYRKSGIVSSYLYLVLSFWFHHMRNALQHVNIVVHLMHYNVYYNVYWFWGFEDKNLSVIVL